MARRVKSCTTSEALGKAGQRREDEGAEWRRRRWVWLEEPCMVQRYDGGAKKRAACAEAGGGTGSWVVEEKRGDERGKG